MPGARTGEGTRWFAVDFANTTACPACQGRDALASARGAREWARRNLPGEPLRVTGRELAALRRFRAQLVELLNAVAEGASPPAGALASVNRAAARAAPYPQLQWTRHGWLVEERGGARPASRRLTGLASRSVMDLLGGPGPTPIRRCSGVGCVHFLVAPTNSQLWCSPTGCGNRARVQRHYRKLRARRLRRFARSRG